MIEIGGYNFSGPWPLSDKDFIDKAAIYAVLCKKTDGKYYPIYFGETGEVSTRLSNHHKSSCWTKKCDSSLYVAVLWTPSSQYGVDDRRDIESKLIKRFNPPCND